MADLRNPDAPPPSPDDPYRSRNYRSEPLDDDLRRAARLDDELQVDPELAEGRASGGRIAMFSVAIAVILGAVFYGLNNSSINRAGTTSSTAQNTAQPSPPAAPPGMRDVTPHANTAPGVTTGAAPASPPAPPTASPPGATVHPSPAPSPPAKQ
jgi:hypothetical protein